jgi:hypothetical protein
MNRPRMLTRRLVPIGAAAVRVVFDAETFSVSAGGITAFAPSAPRSSPGRARSRTSTADAGSPKGAGQGPRWGRVPDLLGRYG